MINFKFFKFKLFLLIKYKFKLLMINFKFLNLNYSHLIYFYILKKLIYHVFYQEHFINFKITDLDRFP